MTEKNSEKRKQEQKPDWKCSLCGKSIRGGHTSIEELEAHLNEMCEEA